MSPPPKSSRTSGPAPRLREYPPRSDPEGFVAHHHRIFTSYVAAAICGADRYKSPLDIWNEWDCTVEEAIARYKADKAKQNAPAIMAGHHWEEANCCLAALHLYGKAFETGQLCIRNAGPVADSLTEDSRATPDALLCEPNGTLVWPPVVIEAKYVTATFPHRPHVSHIFQLHHQMHTLRVRKIFISYAHGLGATADKGFRNAKEFRVRVFQVLFCDALWTWMSERRNLFRQLLAKNVKPTAENGFPRLHENFESYWVRGEPDPSGLLPPEPKWTLLKESRSYSLQELTKLPKRLPAMPTEADV